MKNPKLLLIALVSLSVMGCAATFPLHMMTINESYMTHPDQYTVLGQVEGSSSVTSILGFPYVGDAGYNAAMKDALAKAEGADGLINVVADTQRQWMLFAWTITTKVHGLAIKKK
jgi:hypothetical protein